eukprot:CAMPEP_0179695496 /NCGR_PEP_ID=MMETSP0936-20121108/6340_1 /TAXON_ID=548131 ORGANISM="Ostreococcus mediterraneus, Strain clade-D-RCC2573" /NCGR_SAMPLE_ID=MMETSP0936 /ASSEMBLY_ACC=CAM_ASM_000574 /LENGTH=73 /DNA_ID=CAMNT_0021568333 /DNA_START=416 /DNA_END=637 /DNA_ORIENTATION=+
MIFSASRSCTSIRLMRINDASLSATSDEDNALAADFARLKDSNCLFNADIFMPSPLRLAFIDATAPVAALALS